ncbi:MAG: cupin-like domain-containing protein [Gammaproteobacteria bacterium]|nr:cupin-like domain-containing protein [Gammaproteobacteria bacterium]
MQENAKSVRVWENVDRDSFAREILPLAQPAILRGLVSDWPVIQIAKDSDSAWKDYLTDFSLEKPVQSFHGAADMGGFFTFSDDLKTFNFVRKQQSLSHVLEQLLDKSRVHGSTYLYAGAVNVSEHLPGFAKEHSNPLIDPAINPEVDQLFSIWVGNKTRVPAHWDLPQNIACVTKGRRRFTLFPIEQVPNMYIGPLDITIAGQPSSLVDPYNPDLERFPKFVEAAKHTQIAELEPGDALFIPSLWLHHVESLDDVGMLVNFWWREGPTATRFTPMHSLMHAILSIRNMPEVERMSWKVLFDQYIFQTGDDPVAHLPEGKRGVLGELGEQGEANLRKYLASRLLR